MSLPRHVPAGKVKGQMKACTLNVISSYLFVIGDISLVVCRLLEPLPGLLLVPQLHVALAKVQPVWNIEARVN